jgi:hypothetical protein
MHTPSMQRAGRQPVRVLGPNQIEVLKLEMFTKVDPRIQQLYLGGQRREDLLSALTQGLSGTPRRCRGVAGERP